MPRQALQIHKSKQLASLYAAYMATTCSCLASSRQARQLQSIVTQVQQQQQQPRAPGSAGGGHHQHFGDARASMMAAAGLHGAAGHISPLVGGVDGAGMHQHLVSVVHLSGLHVHMAHMGIGEFRVNVAHLLHGSLQACPGSHLAQQYLDQLNPACS